MAYSTNTTRILSIFILASFCACSGGTSDGHAKKKARKEEEKLAKDEKKSAEQGGSGLTPGQPSPSGASVGDAKEFASTGCDASLSNHVYNPARLQQLTPCISVSGTVQESAPDDDGDQHFLLKLDPGQESLVNQKNQKRKTGALVLEIVCANPVTQRKRSPPAPATPIGSPSQRSARTSRQLVLT
jgi:hypothetical protein